MSRPQAYHIRARLPCKARAISHQGRCRQPDELADAGGKTSRPPATLLPCNGWWVRADVPPRAGRPRKQWGNRGGNTREETSDIEGDRFETIETPAKTPVEVSNLRHPTLYSICCLWRTLEQDIAHQTFGIRGDHQPVLGSPPSPADAMPAGWISPRHLIDGLPPGTIAGCWPGPGSTEKFGQ